MRTLYPEIKSNQEQWLAVGSEHEIRFETSGNPNGIPVLFFHGGPASGCKPDHRRFFDPEKYHIVLFDQRGCGQSRPYGRLIENTTDDLLEDAERIRRELNIDSWLIFGGSWGGTLGLLYAERFPERTAALVIRGCFLARNRDLDWYFGDGVRGLYPEAHDELLRTLFIDGTDPNEPVVDALASQILGADEGRAFQLACAWERFTSTLVSMALSESFKFDPPKATDERTKLLSKVRIEMHYARHRYFIEDNQILTNISRLPAVPVYLIHGRRDVTCLPEASWELHRAIANSSLKICHNAGHLANEAENVHALLLATDDVARRLA